jgi:hypothetical protein
VIERSRENDDEDLRARPSPKSVPEEKRLEDDNMSRAHWYGNGLMILFFTHTKCTDRQVQAKHLMVAVRAPPIMLVLSRLVAIVSVTFARGRRAHI